MVVANSDDFAARNRSGGSVSADRPLRCAFVHTPNSDYADTQNYGAKFMPVWAYTLAAHIPEKDGHILSLFDTRFDAIGQITPQDVFLFSGVNQDYTYLIQIVRELRQNYPAAKFIVGGPICWSFDQAGDIDKLDAFDVVAIGDGEDLIGDLLRDISNGQDLPAVIRQDRRFPIARARAMHPRLLEATIGRYYGAVLEVSRGCPFLCEFCDIRILPDNNRAHNKSADLIIEELDHLAKLGVMQVLFACDNFIGEPRWAEAVVDKIIAWQQRTGHRLSLYTWLTINLYKLPWLMRKMRLAGFDLLFIGIESFAQNSLLETAKIQNSSVELTEAVAEVQSYGFIVVAGLIFGFDSDDETSFDLTLRGMQESGLLSGDPSLLTALPGTPLYRRMKLSGRLREVRYGLGGFKYQTNIKYLMPRQSMVDGYRHFVHVYNRGSYQLQRLRTFLKILERGNFIPLESSGYGDFRQFFGMVLRSGPARKQLLQRLWRFGRNPVRVIFALRGLGAAIAARRNISGALNYFNFWLFAWSNSVLKYHDLSEDDFDVESVAADFDLRALLPANYESSADEAVPKNKIKAQQRLTIRALTSIIAKGEARRSVSP